MIAQRLQLMQAERLAMFSCHLKTSDGSRIKGLHRATKSICLFSMAFTASSSRAESADAYERKLRMFSRSFCEGKVVCRSERHNRPTHYRQHKRLPDAALQPASRAIPWVAAQNGVDRYAGSPEDIQRMVHGSPADFDGVDILSVKKSDHMDKRCRLSFRGGTRLPRLF